MTSWYSQRWTCPKQLDSWSRIKDCVTLTTISIQDDGKPHQIHIIEYYAAMKNFV